MTAKTGLFAVTAAAAIVTFAAGWAISQQSRIAGATGQVDTFKMMTTGNNCLPSTSQIIPSYSIESPLSFSAGTSYERKGGACPARGPSPEVVTTPQR